MFICYVAEPCEPPCPPMSNSNVVLAGASGASTSSVTNTLQVPPTSHHPPYDLRRKSPPYHDNSTASTSSPPSYTSTYSMLPARKRPRRTCSVSNESKATITKFLNVLFLRYMCLLIYIRDKGRTYLIFLIY